MQNRLHQFIDGLKGVAESLENYFRPNDAKEIDSQSDYPEDKVSIIGGGIVGFLEAYYTYLAAKKAGKKVRVTMYEKNHQLTDTTSTNIAPSLTINETLAVVDRGKALTDNLKRPFYKKRGILVEDVPEINNDVAEKFKKGVESCSDDVAGYQDRTEKLLELGKLSMQLWQDMYDNGDDELRAILRNSNFNPCREPLQDGKQLHDGYRIDLMYNMKNPAEKAKGLIADFERFGYEHCAILSPDEVMARDSFLIDFCEKNSHMKDGQRVWNNDAVALWRPGGCIDMQSFLPQFKDYLTKVMGKYVDETGQEKDCFQFRLDRNVEQVAYEQGNKRIINGLKFMGHNDIKTNHHNYKTSNYVFCPGENVGTLTKLGFKEPPHARFAGASLKLNIDIPADRHDLYEKLNHCMEVYQEGVVLAWQSRIKNNKISIAVAGTKAFYSDQVPNIDQAFAKDRNLLQLNMINDVLPELITLAFHSIGVKRNTKGEMLTFEDLELLVKHGIATRWVGSRAVTEYGFPAVGKVYNEDGDEVNARFTGYGGSGFVSSGPGAVVISQASARPEVELNELEKAVLNYGSTFRR